MRFVGDGYELEAVEAEAGGYHKGMAVFTIARGGLMHEDTLVVLVVPQDPNRRSSPPAPAPAAPTTGPAIGTPGP